MIVKAYKYIENIWFRLNEKIRFILVGGKRLGNFIWRFNNGC